MASSTLTPPQLQALFDILVHHETYTEVESFKNEKAINGYGYPFAPPEGDKDAAGDDGGKSKTPLLQLVFTRMVLPTPGFNTIPQDFWHTQFRNMMMRLGRADLSESYDKGTLGTRKRLATAASAIHEAVTRGLLAGVACEQLPDLKKEYDVKTAEGLTQAWDDSVEHLVHGNLAEELFSKATSTKDFLGAHSPAVAGARDYAIIHIAALLHYIFVLSPEGPYLLKLFENVHSLIPYSVIAQTFRIGNAATMINGMVRLFLAKVSVGAITNWFGLTRDAADGMNLLQRIISMVLEWDTSEFRKAIESIKKSKDRVSDKHLAALDQHVQSSRDQHDSVREASMSKEESIVVAILRSKDAELARDLTELHHTQCLEYYSAQLAIRDRQKLIEATCHLSPDYMTSMIREALSAFDPMIRTIHSQTDLRKHIVACEAFFNDFIKTAKGTSSGTDDKSAKDKKTDPPTAEDFVALLERHCDLPFCFLHDVAQGCPDIREMWCSWAKDRVKVFRDEGTVPGSTSGVGKVTQDMQNLFNQIPSADRQAALGALDAHVDYLAAVGKVSNGRMQGILDSKLSKAQEVEATSRDTSGNLSGPGVYLSSWQSLLDKTLITPDKPTGAPRSGKDVKAQKAAGKTDTISSQESWDPMTLLEQEDKDLPDSPDVSIILRCLEPKFRDLVAGISAEGLTKE